MAAMVRLPLSPNHPSPDLKPVVNARGKLLSNLGSRFGLSAGTAERPSWEQGREIVRGGWGDVMLGAAWKVK